jgi:hypothetical protein
MKRITLSLELSKLTTMRDRMADLRWALTRIHTVVQKIAVQVSQTRGSTLSLVRLQSRVPSRWRIYLSNTYGLVDLERYISEATLQTFHAADFLRDTWTESRFNDSGFVIFLDNIKVCPVLHHAILRTLILPAGVEHFDPIDQSARQGRNPGPAITMYQHASGQHNILTRGLSEA